MLIQSMNGNKNRTADPEMWNRLSFCQKNQEIAQQISTNWVAVNGRSPTSGIIRLLANIKKVVYTDLKPIITVVI